MQLLPALLSALSVAFTDAPAPQAPLDAATLSQAPRTLPIADAGPQGDFPPAPPRGVPRAANAGLSVGPGFLALRDELGRDGQGATSFAARVGMVVAPEWNLVLGIDHARTDRGEATFSQTAALLGIHRYFFGRLYFGGAMGLGWVRESGVPDGLTDGPGIALSAALGFELVRRPHWALTAEAGLTYAQYEKEGWEMSGLRLGVLIF